MTINEKISDILTSYYGINDKPKPFGNGHINDTFIAGDNIIQRVNTNIFEDCDGLMNNIMLVTDYLKRKVAENKPPATLQLCSVRSPRSSPPLCS